MFKETKRNLWKPRKKEHNMNGKLNEWEIMLFMSYGIREMKVKHINNNNINNKNNRNCVLTHMLML